MVLDAAPHRSRRMWEAVERFHAGPVYLEPECREEAAAAGAKGFWMGYFATRVAPLGAVGAAATEAIFFYFSPRRVRRSLPDAWTTTTPQAMIEARLTGVDRALRRMLHDVDSPAMAEAADLAELAAASGSTVARPLFAGWREVPRPDSAHVRLWLAATALREHRSASHAMALALHGIDGCESVVSQAAVAEGPLEWVEGEAQWSEDEAAAARERLVARGWLDATGAATPAGIAGRAAIEAATDDLDDPLWSALGEQGCSRLEVLLADINTAFPPDDQLDWRSHYPNETTH